MAVIQKTLFAKNLDRYAVLVNDTEPNSKYFKITELPDTFTGGKNAFLIAGSKELVPDTKIQIELRDASGNIIYNEPGEGIINTNISGSTNTPIITEYFEGVSKVVAVYVYPDTAFGPCTLTILGELSEYTDTNGIVVPVGLDWENKYNVKWTKTINVNPSLANTTKIRFYQRPTATITEILSPIYSIVGDNKVASAVTQSFANIKLSKLETFAGDVKRVKVFRTSQGDISDYDLIQDILIESKELLTSYGLSGSVIGETGILTSETLKNYWNTGSLNAFLTSSRVESGVRLTGSGYFRYTSSLDIKSANTYELNLDAFYSSSTSSNLGIYLSQVTTSGDGITPTIVSSSITTLIGTQPTKNLLDTVVPFKIDRNYPSASLYFSQSQGDWHVGNISLKLSQDTAFSPDEVSFVTTMPTVLGNETFNFKFEFYDVNNNYVPVSVTQSATFNGGNTNIGGTILLISSSASSSLADLNRVSSSISGTMTTYSSSASGSLGVVSGSVYTLSGSVSSSLSSLSSSVSSSNVFILSSSLSKVQQLADGVFNGQFISGSVVGDTFIFSPVVGGIDGYFSNKFQVGKTNPIVLDASSTTRKIYVGTGTYNNTNTSVYMDSGGQFSLKNKLTWDGISTLTVTGQINIEAGGNAATTTNVSTAATNAVTSGSNAAANAVISGSNAASAVDAKVFTDSTGKLSKTPSTSASGLYLGSNYLGYYNGSAWKTYMANNGNFYLSGTGTNGLTWDGTTLSINGNLAVGTTLAGSSFGTLATKSSVSATSDVTGLGNLATKDTVSATYIDDGAISNAKIADNAVNAGKIATDAITSGKIASEAVIAGKIAANAVTADQIAAGSITATKITAGAITADAISAGAVTAGKISVGDLVSLNADIGGWKIDSTSLYKVNGAYKIKLSSTDTSYNITKNVAGVDVTKVKISAATVIPTISVSSTDSIYFAYNGTNRYTTHYGYGYDTRELGGTSGRHDAAGGPGTDGPRTGIIQLIYSDEEIWVDSNELDPAAFDAVILPSFYDYNDYGDANYTLELVAEKYNTWQNAYDRTNIVQTYRVTIASATWVKDQGASNSQNDYSYNLSGGGLQVDSNNNWFYVYLIQSMAGRAINNTPMEEAPQLDGNDFDGNVKVTFGRVDNGYSQFAPAGLQIYTGVRNYMNASVSNIQGENFFEVKGKSAFLTGLFVNGIFSSTNKQFQITHPLNENKWLYHTAIEAPRADLIYRGVLNLINGEGISNIDLASNLTIGTFDALTKNPQLFLQNNESFDRVKGKIESGSIHVISENQNSTASIDWSVIAERRDVELLTGGTYNSNGNYKTEKWKSSFVNIQKEKYITGSI